MGSPKPTLNIIGGGYDQLARISDPGREALRKARLIIRPEALEGAFVREINPGAAELIYAPDGDPAALAAEQVKSGQDTALLLMDGEASGELLEAAGRLRERGSEVGYHPTVPLWRAAAFQASFDPGEDLRPFRPGEASGDPAEDGRERTGTVVHVLPRSRGTFFKDLERVMPSEGEAGLVGFDGRSLWPLRVLPHGETGSLISSLPGDGALFVFPPGSFEREGGTGLARRGVVVTRSLEEAGKLGSLLRAREATPFYFPTITASPPDDWSGVDRALDELGTFQGIIFSSPTAVRIFTRRLKERGGGPERLSGLQIMAVGSRTAAVLEALGIGVDDIPDRFRAEGLVDILSRQGIEGRRYLLPRPPGARKLLPERIEEMGGEAVTVQLYRTVAASPDTDHLMNLSEAGVLDALTFTSGSTFEHFVGILGEAPAGELLRRSTVACIGPVTAAVIRGAGHRVDVMPGRSTAEDMVSALEEHFRGQ